MWHADIEKRIKYVYPFRRILIRWEKKVENYKAMLHFACLIAFDIIIVMITSGTHRHSLTQVPHLFLQVVRILFD
jgi:hypothetical protein